MLAKPHSEICYSSTVSYVFNFLLYSVPQAGAKGFSLPSSLTTAQSIKLPQSISRSFLPSKAKLVDTAMIAQCDTPFNS